MDRRAWSPHKVFFFISFWTPKNLQIQLNPQLTGGLVSEEYFFAVLALV
jgi:hypothetical protein